MKRLCVILLLLNISCVKPEPKFPVYGNWCGPEHPYMKRFQQQNLGYPMALDAIDHACKTHDLCYKRYGRFEKACDIELANNLNQIQSLNQTQRVVMGEILNHITPSIRSKYYYWR